MRRRHRTSDWCPHRDDPNGCRHYYVVRFYMYEPAVRVKRKIKTRLTLAEARAHCSDPETSSTTCTTSAGRARTLRFGPWFDGYDHER